MVQEIAVPPEAETVMFWVGGAGPPRTAAKASEVGATVRDAVGLVLRSISTKARSAAGNVFGEALPPTKTPSRGLLSGRVTVPGSWLQEAPPLVEIHAVKVSDARS